VAVQVSAFRVRQEADALANRLVGKGYTAYVVPPAPGAPALFRVRVGKFKEQREADKVAARLKKEEQFDPWIVR
jgi:cell division septation protein DedD